MQRRTFVSGLAASASVGLLPRKVGATAERLPWDELRRCVGERLIGVRSPLIACARSRGRGCDALVSRLKNPYFLSDEPGLAQTLGWVGAWTFQPSLKAVVAESSADVAAAVDFARRHGVRPVIKGGGHSYFGNSSGAGTLLIWTRRLNGVQLNDSFVPAGAPAGTLPERAVTLGAGALWGHVYRKVAAENGRYVQGGGCLTVGAAGFVQSGGFGSFSKRYGTGAANLLEAEVVTADGVVRRVSRYREPDLFFALRGGGGGTFAVMTELTMKTHPLPAHIGAAIFSVEARSAAAWRALVDAILTFYTADLFNPGWGEQLRFSPSRHLSVSMLASDLDQQGVERIWRPFIGWLSRRSSDYGVRLEPGFIAVPGDRFWDPGFLTSLPGVVPRDSRPGAPAENIFWSSNLGEAGQVLYAYQSAWLPARLLVPGARTALVEALVAASSEWPVTLHTNKGLAGGSGSAIAATSETAMNPQVLDAFALLICAADAPPAWPGLPGHEHDVRAARLGAAAVARAMVPIRAVAPKSGAYVSEADYFEDDWQNAYWGSNFGRLARIKRKYDPYGLFHGHHTVS